MEFKYKIKTQAGESRQGIIEANTRQDAINALQSKGFYVIDIIESEKIKRGLKREIHIEFLEKISKKDIAIFTRQLAMMIKANVPLSEGLQALSEQTKKKKFKKQILSIREEISHGRLLSQALSKFPKTFSTLYVSLIASGETVGKLADSLFFLADYLDKEIKLRSEIKSALIYPIFVLIFAIVAGIIAIVRIIPEITEAFVGMELPLLTRILISFSDFLIAYGILILLSLILFFSLLSILLKTDKGTKIKASIFLSLPIFGPFLKKICITRFVQSLSVLIASGVPIIKSLRISSKTTDNIIYEKMIIESSNNIGRGGLLSAYFKQHPNYFPVIFTQTLSIGEKAGQMSQSLTDIDEYYQREVEVTAKNFMELLSPIIMIFLGIGVGILMLAIWTPMFEMIDPAVIE